MAVDLPEEGANKPDAEAFGKGLGPGLGINLLVTDMERSLQFQTDVLDAKVTYWDRDFAIVQRDGTVWMLHHDRTYHANALRGVAAGATMRGAGVELRIYGRNPDAAVAAAERIGAHVLADPADKPHGLNEAYIVDPDGYVWVVSRSKG